MIERKNPATYPVCLSPLKIPESGYYWSYSISIPGQNDPRDLSSSIPSISFSSLTPLYRLRTFKNILIFLMVASAAIWC